MFPPKPTSTKGNQTRLTIELVFYSFLVYVLILSIISFQDVAHFTRLPTLIFVIRSVFLFIHEGGHFLFSFFGRTLHLLGGSFWQIMFPLLSFIIAVKEKSKLAPLPLFLTGFNMMDVSVYMRDAPYRHLPLITRDISTHDWWNLFRSWNMLDSAETFADITFVLGIVLGIGAIGAGLFIAIESYRHPSPATPFTLEE
ncbi:MAG: hypothetical protein HY960_07385 [Ignavibacteriae bacterium]|nr:hypothetical protein [Ignavibacteriota bacterium]